MSVRAVGRVDSVGADVVHTVREEVVRTAKTMSAEGLVVGMVGNVSARIGDSVVITPTRTPYDRMRAEDLVSVDMDGNRSQGEAGLPSIELPLHLAVYCDRPDLAGVVHVHSPHASAWSFLGEPLDPITEENRYHRIGPVRTTPPASPGSEELATAVATALGASLAVLLGGHGVLAAGATVEEALDVARVVERQAEIAWILRGREPRPT